MLVQTCPGSLLTLIGSCRIYYVFKIKASGFRKRYLSCNRFARKQFVRIRFFGKFCSLFITMAFVNPNPDLISCTSTHR